MSVRYFITAPDGTRHTATGREEFRKVIAVLRARFGTQELSIWADVVGDDNAEAEQGWNGTGASLTM